MAGTGHADTRLTYITGNALLALCQSTSPEDRSDCYGYIVGIADVLDAGNPVNGISACMDSQIVQRQLWDIVTQWMVVHPAVRQLGASGLVAGALSDAFPCPAQ